MRKDILEGVKQELAAHKEFMEQLKADQKPKEKLVRDSMPDLCNNSPDMTPMNYRVASEDEIYGFLINKLYEEVGEVGALLNERGKGTKTLYELGEELADVKEVLEAIAVNAGLFPNDIDIIQKEKWAKKGGFKKRIIWDGVK